MTKIGTAAVAVLTSLLAACASGPSQQAHMANDESIIARHMVGEAMLACSGRIGRLGSIAAGTTVSDYHASEREHRISVHCSLLHT